MKIEKQKASSGHVPEKVWGRSLPSFSRSIAVVEVVVCSSGVVIFGDLGVEETSLGVDCIMRENYIQKMSLKNSSLAPESFSLLYKEGFMNRDEVDF